MGDINHDRKPDIVLGEETEDGATYGMPTVISVLLGNGRGGFKPPVDFNPGQMLILKPWR